MVFLVFIHLPDQMAKPNGWTLLPRLHHELDLAGFVLFAPAPIMLLLALQYGGNQFAWNSSEIIGLFCGAGAMFIVWLIWDWRAGDNAMIPLSMARKTTIWSAALNQSFLMTTLFCASYFMPIYFQAVSGATPIMSGVDLLPAILSQLILAVLTGFLGTCPSPILLLLSHSWLVLTHILIQFKKRATLSLTRCFRASWRQSEADCCRL
jgi:hypothetical protein